MKHWTIELGEFSGGFRIVGELGSEQDTWYVQDKLTDLIVHGMLQPKENQVPIEACRLSIGMNNHIDVVGQQRVDGLMFGLTIQYQFHAFNGEQHPRRIEELFVSVDMPHIGDTLSVVRNSALSKLATREAGPFETQCIHWHGVVDSVSIIPILHESLFAETCMAYGLVAPVNNIVFRAPEEGD